MTAEIENDVVYNSVNPDTIIQSTLHHTVAEAITETQMMAIIDATYTGVQDIVAAVFVENPTDELRATVGGVVEWVKDPNNAEAVSAAWNKALVSFNKTEEAIDVPLEALVMLLEKSVAEGIKLLPLPEGGEDPVVVWTMGQLSRRAAQMMTKNFLEHNQVGYYFTKFGVPAEYRPSEKELELAVLTANLVLSALEADKTRVKIQSAGALYTPGR